MIRIAGTLLFVVALAFAWGAKAQEDGADAPSAAVPEAEARTDGPVGTKGDLVAPDKGTAEERRTARLDLMFGRLAAASSQRRADRIAGHIMRRLNRSGSATVDVLMERAGRAMKAKRYARALDLLDGVVRMEPEFAEGWNRRATVHFMRGDYGASLSDIEQVLRREPRHWGALAGLSMILVAIERKAEAVEIMDRALAIHPFLEEMKERRERLLKEISGADI